MIFHQPYNSLTNHNYNAMFYKDYVWENHFHRNLELIYVIEGKVDCTLNGTHYTMKKGDFGLCLPYDIHSYRPSEGTSYWILVFSEDFVHSFSKEIKDKTGTNMVFCSDKNVEEYIKNKLIYNPTPTLFTLKSCLYAICEEYIKNVKLIKKDSKNQEIIAMVANYVSERYSENITLSDMAKKFNFDYNYMSRYFKKMFDMSFTDFVNLYRLEAATEYLITTDKSIIEIAMMSGFQSVRNFNLFFKKNMGITPSEYRKSYSDKWEGHIIYKD